jgi:predicted enzyme related to lactoylglutathione lyase
MSKIVACRYVIAVNGLKKSADYYQNILGFTIHQMGDDGWRIFEKEECRIMAGHCPEAIPPKQLGDHAYFAYLTVDGLDDYFAEVKAKGGRILKPPRDESWGMREFAVQTIDGHRIMFGTEIE